VRVAFTFGAFLFAGAFYLLLIDITDLPELYAGAGVCVLAALAGGAALAEDVAGLAPLPAASLRVWRALVRIPRDVVLVSLSIAAQAFAPRRARGVLRAFPFDPAASGSRAAARRALAEAAGSLAPNTIVIGVDAHRKLILVHQLRRRGGAKEVDVLELG
jgi:hypothetical protein